MVNEQGITGPLGSAGSQETLITLPWFYRYLLVRTRHVQAVHKLCNSANVPFPDKASCDIYDPAAIQRYIESVQVGNQRADEEAAALLKRATRR